MLGGQEQEGQGGVVAQGFECVLERAPGRTATGSVAVEAEHDAVGLAQQGVDMLRRGRGAERGDRILDGELGERDHVHVALDHDREAGVADRLLRQEEAVELAPLLEQRGLGRVQVLGFALVEHAPAEGDDASAAVVDREDDAVAEAVVAPPLLVVDDQAGVGERLRLVVGEGLLQRLPLVGRVAEPEARGDLARQPAALEVVDGLAGRLELVAVEARRHRHRLIKAFARVVMHGCRAAAIVGHLQADLGSELLDRVDEAQSAVLHQEADRAAVHAATEAVVELLGRADRERGGFLAVEGAAGEVVGAALLEREVAFDDVDDVDAGKQFLDEGLGNHRARKDKRPSLPHARTTGVREKASRRAGIERPRAGV